MPRLKYDLSDMPDGFVDLEVGKFPGRLVSCSKGKSKSSGNPMLTWEWLLLAGENKGQKARSWTSLQEQALGGLKQHLLALGFKKTVNVDTEELIGKKVILVIGKRERTLDDGRKVNATQVTAVLPVKTQEADEEDEEEEAPKKKKAAKDEDEEDEDEDEDDEKPKAKKKNKASDDDEDEEPF